MQPDWIELDSVGGASGDMLLAALLDLGVERDALQAALDPLAPGAFSINTETVSAHGMSGLRVRVNTTETNPPHRHLPDIRALIEAAGLPGPAAGNAIRVFERLAEAEAAVHGTEVDHVHFHEVGALDSIVDIVGTCVAMHMLGAASLRAGPLPLGRGTTRSAHGVIPVPAPATVALLQGHPVVQTDEPYELVTPTAAALVVALAAVPAPSGSARIRATGHAFGHRTLSARPNLLRARLASACAATPGTDACTVLECNIDDMNPELCGALFDTLLAAGALDVFVTPVHMKKQRPGLLVTVLAPLELQNDLRDVLFRESTTFGIRETRAARSMLDRRHVDVTTDYGPVRVKVGEWKGQRVTRAPEYEDCVARARTAGVPVRRVYEQALECAARTLTDGKEP